MRTSTKYEIRRAVRTKMLPKPYWNWEAIPECRSDCPLFTGGTCAWTKLSTAAQGPCVPCITKALERVK
jgi:hypothetical protein